MVGFFSKRPETGILFGFGDFLPKVKLKCFSDKILRPNLQLAMVHFEIRLNHFEI
ncbi:hypothetical protein ADICYQ_1555 [Cyclobacterium qasimii M12-11B]|uniref:Uncharacterized protein n=1 Tax=Cyclobacterium qasimii M12-11B TaxID=641524 RepID=S7WZV0_9BACT|nr:hypothetical protein ADICYQ_1555 [Cyclobacterium qasimii M12-11B]